MYSNLEDVYDPELERRRFEENKKREETLSEEIAKGFESIAQLTNDHLKAKGLHQKTPPKVEDDAKAAQGQIRKEEEDEKPNIELKTSETKKKVVTTKTHHEEVREETTRTTLTANRRMLSDISEESRQSHNSNNSGNNGSDSETYSSLGATFRDLTEKMKDVTANINNVPFIDDTDAEEENADDYDEDKLDKAILEATGLSDQVTVTSIEVEEGKKRETIRYDPVDV